MRQSRIFISFYSNDHKSQIVTRTLTAQKACQLPIDAFGYRGIIPGLIPGVPKQPVARLFFHYGWVNSTNHPAVLRCDRGSGPGSGPLNRCRNFAFRKSDDRQKNHHRKDRHGKQQRQRNLHWNFGDKGRQ